MTQPQLGTVAVYGLITWLATKVVVESEIIRPLRERAPERFKLHYLVSCNLCVGVWIGVILGIVAPVPGLGVVFTGLAYKSLAHIVLIVENLIERIAR